MKTAVRIAGLIGLVALIGLVIHQGAGAIADALSQAGWVLLLLVPFHVLPLLLDTLGWRSLLDRRPGRPHLHVLVGIAAIRESINRLLPAANIGGEVVGIRLLAMRGVPATQAAASVIIEVLATIAAQYVFIALGLFCLMRVAQESALIQSVTLALAMGLPLLVLLAVLLRHGSVFERLGRLAQSMIGGYANGRDFITSSAALDAAVRRLQRSHGRLAAALLWQLAGFIVSSLETWMVLNWLKRPVSITGAIALESITQAVRHFAFLVPAGLGVQEAAFIGLGAVMGIPSETSLALSLAKRMREVLFGVPALLSWHWIETLQLRRARSHRRGAGAQAADVESARHTEAHEPVREEQP